MSKRIVLAALILLFVLPNASSAAFTENSEEFQNVIKQLDMQGHAEDELSSCSVKQLYYEEVLEMLNSGMSEKEVLQSYIDEYGQAALRTPATDKSGWIAWGMPFAGLAGGIAIVAAWLKKVKGKGTNNQNSPQVKWESEAEKEIAEQMFEEERRKHF
ncbi:cytochrome c-type biogenesis protein CcmH [Mesobacillus persicus]|uniref:Cytochrome c-type biogenesis protein n=1 Tax=Mesobacillus persicus TaxID=930146 RepID=A0A1H7Y2T1_9BACI|nr:cytochrome c-type biogenesis protein CcmH [Mesobacillus persicus]SEM40174.1 cytochrome c-type biogenesis protein CcmH [Mesobacillus persicus]